MPAKTMIDPPKYEIRTVLDFLKVPKHRRARCLKEFRSFLEICEQSAILLGPGVKTRDCFTWIDDNERNVTITLHPMPENIEP
jgi:hypothetical protein